MITEDYVSFETSKLLKEKGFNEPTIMIYNDRGVIDNVGSIHHYNSEPTFKCSGYISAPTHQRAMKWLRKIHNISIEPFVDSGSGDEHWWTADIGYIKKNGLINELCGYNSYEEAAEAALKYTLENLI